MLQACRGETQHLTALPQLLLKATHGCTAQVSQVVAQRAMSSPDFASSGIQFTERGMVEMKNKGERERWCMPGVHTQQAAHPRACRHFRHAVAISNL